MHIQVISLASGGFWIGLTDTLEEGTFVWESGKPLSADVDTHWAAGEPNNYKNSDCTMMTSNRVLHDVGCHIESKFVCQKRLRSECMIRERL